MPSNEVLWRWYSRDDKTKLNPSIKSPRTLVHEHPLQSFSVILKVDTQSSTSKNDDLKEEEPPFSDPLGLMLDGNDPLSLFQRQAAEKDYDEDLFDTETPIRGQFRKSPPWEKKKEEILNLFTLQEMVQLTSCFAFLDKETRRGSRQEQETDDSIISEFNELSPSEFYKKIQALHDDVIKAWEDDQRVKAIKIVIQCAKLLSDSYSYALYPLKFVYLTDILETFGNLVYTRLKIKCQESWQPNTYNGHFVKMFPEKFTCDIVPGAAKDTCHNWFYKVASIRELIPRLYVEISLLRSHTFIHKGKFEPILSRLTKMIRGVGNPLVNIYLRCFLCRTVANCYPNVNYNIFAENFFEFVAIYRTIFTKDIVVQKRIDVMRYVEAFVPAFEWILLGLVTNDDTVQESICQSFQTTRHNSMLLLVTMSSFKSSFVVDKAQEFMTWILASDYEEVPIYKLMRHFGLCFEEHFDENLGVINSDILNSAWSLINKIENTQHYINCVEQWLPLSISSLSIKQIDNLLGEIVVHMRSEKDPPKFYPQLQNVVIYLMDAVNGFLRLIIAENFMPFVRLFRSETHKINISKIILESFIKRSNETFITDQVVLNNMMTIAGWLHDSISALTVEDEKRQIGKLLSSFVMRIDFGRDFEQQLQFFVDARGSFYNLSIVHVILVYRVNKLAIDTLKIVRGRHTSRTSAFVRACAAYCFITIPSLSSPLTRLQLYMLSGQTSLANQCLGQTDAFFKAAIETIPEIPRKLEGLSASTSDHIVMSYIRELFSILIVVPDNPTESNSLTLIRLLSNILLKYPWLEINSARISMYIQALYALNVSFQSEYPYHFLNVDSNDSLYASDAQFRVDINDMCSILLQQIFKSLIALGESENTRMQAKLSYELFFCVLTRGDVSHKDMAKLAVNLWNLASKNESVDKSIAIKTLNCCIRTSSPNSIYAEVFSKLLAKLE